MQAVVMAAGEGRRLRPLTERYAKPVLPIDGRPVVVTVVRDLREAGAERITVVTGHLAEQVERLLDGLDVGFVRQPEALGGADTLFSRGAIPRFVRQAAAYDNAVAVRPRPGSPLKDRIKVENVLVARFDNDDPGDETTGAPLWLVGPTAHAHLGSLSGPPFELKEALERARRGGARTGAIEIGPTRDLTDPFDLVEENFGYLKGL